MLPRFILKPLLKRVCRRWETRDEERMQAFVMPEGVAAELNTSYINGGGEFEKLDIRYPEKNNGKMPAIVNFHGGGLLFGNRSVNRFFAAELARRGFLVFSPGYRLLTEVNFFKQFGDIINSLEYISKNLERFGGDRERVFLTGDSAGAYLAALGAQALADKDMRKAFSLPEIDMRAKAIGIIGGMMELHSELRFSPIVNKMMYTAKEKKQPYFKYYDFTSSPSLLALPPMYITTSEQDALKTMSFYFVDLIKKHSLEYKYRFWEADEKDPLVHVFPVVYPFRKESQESIDEMTNYFLSLE